MVRRSMADRAPQTVDAARAGGTKRPVLDAKAYRAALKAAKPKQAKGRKQVSQLEESFANLWLAKGGILIEGTKWLLNLTPQREYQFDDARKWRFDFAWPMHKVAVELEGGVYTRGRHTRATGFIADCAKYNAAAISGWKVLRFTKADLATEEASANVVAQVQRALLGEEGR